jgi:hypothetical protein
MEEELGVEGGVGIKKRNRRTSEEGTRVQIQENKKLAASSATVEGKAHEKVMDGSRFDEAAAVKNGCKSGMRGVDGGFFGRGFQRTCLTLLHQPASDRDHERSCECSILGCLLRSSWFLTREQ